MIEKKQRIVVVGGGFAGMNFVKHIDKRKYEVILVDKHNYHAFPPLFYQVASSELDPTSICFPLRREVRKRRVRGVDFHIGKVRTVDMHARTITTDYETIPFDILVLAMGTTNNFFGNPDLIHTVYTLKSTDQAIRIRNAVLYRCERAAVEPDPGKRRRLLGFSVIGGGPAGVEIAGALGELKRYILPRDYPELSPSEMSIDLFEGSDRLLGTMSPEASATALRDLGQLMVNVHLGRRMTSYADDVLSFDDGSQLYSETVIWTAGVTGVPVEITGAPDFAIGRGGRFATNSHCAVEGLEDVYALGDINLTTDVADGRGYPQLAQVAIQQGRYLARCLNAGEFRRPFRYKDKGAMATIGRNRAVADIGRIHLRGFAAWLAWMFIHLISLLGMRSKLSVILNWTWAYFSYNTALRLLLGGARHPDRRTEGVEGQR